MILDQNKSSLPVNAHVVSLAPEVYETLAKLMRQRSPGRPFKASRTGFTQKQVAKWFQVSEKEVSRWESGEVTAPVGYSLQFRQSGDWLELERILKIYWDLKRSQGADVYAAGKVIHSQNEEFLHHKRLK